MINERDRVAYEDAKRVQKEFAMFTADRESVIVDESAWDAALRLARHVLAETDERLIVERFMALCVESLPPEDFENVRTAIDKLRMARPALRPETP